MFFTKCNAKAGRRSLILYLLLCVPLWGQSSEFDAFEEAETNAFADFQEQEDQAYTAFMRAEAEAFAQFRQEVEALWGNYETPAVHEWVEYSDDKRARTEVNLEEGVATIEVLVEEGADPTESLRSAVEQVALDRGKSADYAVPLPDGSVVQPEPLSEKPVLAEQLQSIAGETVTAANVVAFAKDVVDQAGALIERVVGGDGQARTKATVSVQLVPDHLKKRAEPYLGLVRTYAQRYGLEVSLVFALMHTESFFNPKARSSAPAFGLMQLVPTSGGRAAYEYVYKESKVMPPAYFYDPKQNIELGCAYLDFVRKAYFDKVTNPQNVEYCIVASYNTGAGNVSRAFTGKTYVKKAIPLINERSPEQLYTHLRKNLPYEETRLYIEKVQSRKPLYEEWN